MTDPRTAALAEALHKVQCAPSVPWPAGHMERHIEDAAAILAALPADWCGHDPGIHSDYKSVADMRAEIAQAQHDAACRDELARQQAAEIVRLRRIEEAARALMSPHTLTATTPPLGESWTGWVWPEWDALRAALEDR